MNEIVAPTVEVDVNYEIMRIKIFFKFLDNCFGEDGDLLVDLKIRGGERKKTLNEMCNVNCKELESKTCIIAGVVK